MKRLNERHAALFVFVAAPLFFDCAGSSAAPSAKAAEMPQPPAVPASSTRDQSGPGGNAATSVELLAFKAVREVPPNVGIGDGGMQAKIRAGTIADKTLRDCTAAVTQIADQWQHQFKLNRAKREVAPHRFLMHAKPPDKTAFYEVNYRFADDGSEAEVHVVLISTNGDVADDFSEEYQLDKLGDDLTKALTCSQP